VLTAHSVLAPERIGWSYTSARPIHAPNHELEGTDTNTLPIKVNSKRILVELLGIREECVILYLLGMNPLA
jgi:hypothetical protein